MSCYYMSYKLNFLIKKFNWFNSLARSRLIIFSILYIIILDIFFSKEILYLGLKFVIIVLFLSFGKDDFLQLLSENLNNKIQSNLYCFSMYFSILIGASFIAFS
jgi:hypothetical protein